MIIHVYKMEQFIKTLRTFQAMILVMNATVILEKLYVQLIHVDLKKIKLRMLQN